MENMYFAFGGDDFIIIGDLPDNVTMAAINMMVLSSGSITAKTTALLTPEEVDEEAKKVVSYRPPGQ